MQKEYSKQKRLHSFLFVFYLTLSALFNKSFGQNGSAMPMIASAQQETSFSTHTFQSSKPASNSIEPVFPGGSDSLQRYLFLHIKAPDSLWSRDISGNIYFSFSVEPDGKITNIKIENGPASPGWDSAAIACIRQMPPWTPGKINDLPTTMQYFLPVYVPPGHQLFDLPDSIKIK